MSDSLDEKVASSTMGDEEVTLSPLSLQQLESRIMNNLSDLIHDSVARGISAMATAPAPAVSAAPLSAALQTPRSRPLAIVRESPFSTQRSASIGTRRPLFLPTQQIPVQPAAPIPSANVSTAAAVGDVSPSSHVDRGMLGSSPPPGAYAVPHPRPNRRVDKPKVFTGTPKERPNSRHWLRKAQTWLELAHEHEPERVLVRLFSTVLDDNASIWFQNLHDRAGREGIELTLQQVFDEFIHHFEGGQTKAWVELQFGALQYGKGACKDLPSMETEFDRLAGQLYPGAELTEAGNALLANRYAEIIQKGHLALWEKAVDYHPSSLDDWKAAVQQAFTVMEIKGAATKQTHQRGFRSSYQSSTSASSTATPSMGNAAPRVFVQQLQHEDSDADAKATWERQEGEQPPAEELQELKANRDNDSKAWPGSHLPKSTRERLKKLGKCWLCYKRGHMAPDCPDKGKPVVGPRRQPTPVELKA
jgi:hypothetical protein